MTTLTYPRLSRARVCCVDVSKSALSIPHFVFAHAPSLHSPFSALWILLAFVCIGEFIELDFINAHVTIVVGSFGIWYYVTPNNETVGYSVKCSSSRVAQAPLPRGGKRNTHGKVGASRRRCGCRSNRWSCGGWRARRPIVRLCFVNNGE
jgi:hypothetical protein